MFNITLVTPETSKNWIRGHPVMRKPSPGIISLRLWKISYKLRIDLNLRITLTKDILMLVKWSPDQGITSIIGHPLMRDLLIKGHSPTKFIHLARYMHFFAWFSQCLLDFNSDVVEWHFYKVSNAVCDTRRDNKVFRFILLQHQPHGLDHK